MYENDFDLPGHPGSVLVARGSTRGPAFYATSRNRVSRGSSKKEGRRKRIPHKDTKPQRGRCPARPRHRGAAFRFYCRTLSGRTMTKLDLVTPHSGTETPSLWLCAR